jgi:hypothetical protein
MLRHFHSPPPPPPYFPADSNNNPAKTTLHLVSYSSSSNVVSNSERHHNDHVNPKLTDLFRPLLNPLPGQGAVTLGWCHPSAIPLLYNRRSPFIGSNMRIEKACRTGHEHVHVDSLCDCRVHRVNPVPPPLIHSCAPTPTVP